ncbi:MAG: site-specific integrase [Anaerolineae bacterium]|nr:site-specific integrase [Anaerolineae bacterium]
MNQSSKGFLPASKALIGFVQYKEAEGIALRSISNYRSDLEKWIEYSGDLLVADVTANHVREYLAYLRTDYVPQRIYGGNDQPLSAKTVRNVWVSFSAFFNGLLRNFTSLIRLTGWPCRSFRRPRFGLTLVNKLRD